MFRINFYHPYGFDRPEALQLYEKLARDEEIDARIKHWYENEIQYGVGNEKNVYRTLYGL